MSANLRSAISGCARAHAHFGSFERYSHSRSDHLNALIEALNLAKINTDSVLIRAEGGQNTKTSILFSKT